MSTTKDTRTTRTTRRHIVDERYAALLEEDFGIRTFHVRALIGVPQRQAMAVCGWAEARSEDPEERGEMVVAWARKRQVGRYDRRLVDEPAPTYNGREPEGV